MDVALLSLVGGVFIAVLGWPSIDRLLILELGAWLGVVILIVVIFGAINGRWLATRGQTVGKRLLHIGIVHARTGEIVPLTKSIGLRFVAVLVVSQVPVVGAALWLADHLFIFGKRRRCLHDYLAGTIVIRADNAGGK